MLVARLRPLVSGGTSKLAALAGGCRWPSLGSALTPAPVGQHVAAPLGGFTGLPSEVPTGSRAFGIRRVKQRRRTRGRIIQLKQTHYEPKPDDYLPLPMSLLGSGPIRRVLTAGTVEGNQLAGAVSWDRYKCDVRGVRWHPVGGWRVQFDKRDYEHNFFVKCSCYFRVQLYGFDRSKELAIQYRQRLEAEWEEQHQIWVRLDAEREASRLRRKEEKVLARQAAAYEDATGESLWGGLDALPPAAGSSSSSSFPDQGRR
mmetsp:Transcript_62167/g.158075  ORF Transcript_62167/g.158075 Transcript_62167/m.158075 type:complete len:258 (-) Transcript_62167:11-784(-)